MKHNWEYKRLGDVCDVRDGTHDTPLFVESGIPLITSKNLTNGYIDFCNVSFISKLDATLINKRSKVDCGDIIMPMIGTIGNPIINNITDDFCIKNVALIKFIEKSPINKFVFYYLYSSNFINYVKSNSKGVTQKFLSLKLIRNLNIPVPPREVQERIVAELDAINEGIAKLREQVKDLDSLAQSLFYETFGDPISNPKAWLLKKIGDIGEVIGGSTPKTNNENYWNGDLLWITPAELKGSKYVYDTERHITEEGRKSAGLQLLPINTVLLTSRAPIGKVAIVKTPMYCNQGFKNIRINEKFIHHEYLFFVLMIINDTLQEKGKGSTFKEISKTVTENIRLPIPPLSLQQQFALQIEEIESMKRELEMQIAEAQTLLDSRMDYWFN